VPAYAITSQTFFTASHRHGQSRARFPARDQISLREYHVIITGGDAAASCAGQDGTVTKLVA
jgi:hypothetical protein